MKKKQIMQKIKKKLRVYIANFKRVEENKKKHSSVHCSFFQPFFIIINFTFSTTTTTTQKHAHLNNAFNRHFYIITTTI